ncbi:MAG TPA: twin-arginine translocation signal domain-containing protein [Thermoanaerobaculia bacterium]|nr:twin-arginine translocation signal domain-containing protein [Thermoanaerobaculia bacterium]
MSSTIQIREREGRGVSRRDFLRTVPVAVAGAALGLDAFARPLTLQPIRLVEDWRGQTIREYVLTIVGVNTRFGYDMAKFLDTACMRSAYDYERLPGNVSDFHIERSSRVIVLGPERSSQIQSGAYVRTANWIYHDSVWPRPFKDLTVDEMRCSLEPETVDRLGAVPFPCGERIPFNTAYEEAYQWAIDHYRKYYDTNGIDLAKCDLEYLRPAQTMPRLNAGRKPVVTVGIVEPKTQKRALLFGPEAA